MPTASYLVESATTITRGLVRARTDGYCVQLPGDIIHSDVARVCARLCASPEIVLDVDLVRWSAARWVLSEAFD